MKAFIEHAFESRACRRELDEFKNLLDGAATLSEKSDVLPFFRKHLHLSALLGTFNPDIIVRDRLAFEYDLFGDFSCDIVVGDAARRAYCFIEFEDAKPDSIFVKKKSKGTPEWGRRFECGYSQIIDWFWKLDDLTATAEFANRFGERPVDYAGLLIIGRDEHLSSQREIQRFQWRWQKVLVNSKHIACFTFDELYRRLDDRMKEFESAAGPG
jgi:Domain of unknown function (DUF4263)